MAIPKSSFWARCLHYIDGYIRVVPLFWWQIIFLLLWFFLVVSGIWLIKKRYYYRIISLVSLSVLCLLIVFIRYSLITQEKAIVLNATPMYVSTDIRLTTGRSLILGQEVAVLQKKDHWCKITHDNQIGWIPTEVITIL